MLQAAQDDLQAVSGNPLFYSKSHDATGAGRFQILDDDWKVCAQNKAPGARVGADDVSISFNVVRVTERCPKPHPMADEQPDPLAFHILDDVAEELATSHAQVYALVRRGELRSMKLGGRGQRRVHRPDLEEYIARLYEETAALVAENPFVETKAPKERDR